MTRILMVRLLIPRQGRLIHAAKPTGEVTTIARCGITYSTGELRQGTDRDVTCSRCLARLKKGLT
jgi:hypothetical protein